MSCNFKTMIKLAAGLAAILGWAFVMLPATQPFIFASAPLLLALACPLAMLVMAFKMKDGPGKNKSEASVPAESQTPHEVTDAAPDRTW